MASITHSRPRASNENAIGLTISGSLREELEPELGRHLDELHRVGRP